MQYDDFLRLKNIIEFILLLEKEFVDEKKKITKINIEYVNKEIENFINLVEDFKWLGFTHSIKIYYATGFNKKEIAIGNRILLSDNISKEDFLYKKMMLEKINFDNRFDIYKEILLTTPLSNNQSQNFLSNIQEQSKTILKNRKRKQYHSSKKIYLPPLEKISVYGTIKEYRPFINNLSEKKEWGSINDIVVEGKFEISLKRVKNLLEKIMEFIVDGVIDEIKVKKNPEFKSIEIEKLDIKKIPNLFELKTSSDYNEAFEKIRQIFIEDAYLIKGLSEGYPLNNKFFTHEMALKAYIQSFLYVMESSHKDQELLSQVSKELCHLYKSKIEKVTILKTINNSEAKIVSKKRI